MTKRFDYFVVFAEMRTGSNFLEANINRFDGLTCYGEAFNGAFIGYPNSENILGITQAGREADPAQLIEVIKTQTKGLGGFRFFSDHDPRVQDLILDDPRCAKIILTRNPIDSFVSLQIARTTGQWKMTNVKHALQEKAHFDADAFTTYLSDLQAFQVRLQGALQRSGQTAFYLAYDDLHDVDVLNGLATFLECEDQIDRLDKKLKRQNPEPIRDKVSNPDDMNAALAALDRFNLSQTPNFEPRRGPRVPHYVAAPVSPLLYIPVPGGPDEMIQSWLSQLDNGAAVKTGFTRKSLRQWKSDNLDHRSFAVVRHPLLRAHTAFCDNILDATDDGLRDVRQMLRKVHDLPLPATYPEPAYDDAKNCPITGVSRDQPSRHGYQRTSPTRRSGNPVCPSWA